MNETIDINSIDKPPPVDTKCQVCGKKSKTMCFVNNLWICIYTECSDKANEISL